MMHNSLPIGFLDSGVGGLSVLKTAIRLMPNENYLYYGDSANAPYGSKSPEQIKELVFHGVKELTDRGIKALVLACNTATAVAVEDLRNKLDIPVIGMEPAVKAGIACPGVKPVLVMATPATLSLPKFDSLVQRLGAKRDVVLLPAPKLAKLVEKGDKQEIKDYLETLLMEHSGRVRAVVLGCTHYVFCESMISEIMPDTPVIHGNMGTVEHLKDILEQNGSVNREGGEITLLSSAGEEMAHRYRRFLE